MLKNIAVFFLSLFVGIIYSVCTSATETNPGTKESQIDGNAISESTTIKTQPTLPTGIPNAFFNLGQGTYYSPYAFLVDKNKRTLSIWQNDEQGIKPIAIYPIDFGKKNGNKQFLGDHRTPEGIYFLQTRLEGKNLNFEKYGSRAFTMDYPNYFDKKAGKTGSGIWLHAVPDNVSLSRGSRGCVVVRDNVIKDVTQYVKLRRTPIVVLDSVDYMPSENFKTVKNEFNTWFENWRQSWEAKEVTSYINNYSENFRSMKMNKSQWLEYKTGLSEKYEYLSVKFSPPVILKHKGEYIVRTLQKFNSDKYSDFGEKTLYIKKENGEFKIVAERWKAIKSQRLQKAFFSESKATVVNFTQPTELPN